MEAFLVPTALFTLAEMGDKTQIATVALAAQYAVIHGAALVAVVLGTSLGMMLANVPVVLLGERITRRIPIGAIHWAAAVMFGILGMLALTNAGGWF